MADPDLVIRILRELRADMVEMRSEMERTRTELRGEIGAVRDELRAFRGETTEHFATLELTVNGIAGHLLGLTQLATTTDRRVRKLEAREAK